MPPLWKMVTWSLYGLEFRALTVGSGCIVSGSAWPRGEEDSLITLRFPLYCSLTPLWTQHSSRKIRIGSGSALLSPGWRWHQPLRWVLAQPLRLTGSQSHRPLETPWSSLAVLSGLQGVGRRLHHLLIIPSSLAPAMMQEEGRLPT